jgi:hypothetical protein
MVKITSMAKKRNYNQPGIAKGSARPTFQQDAIVFPTSKIKISSRRHCVPFFENKTLIP